MQTKARRRVNEIIVHCSATPEGRVVTAATIRRWHLDRGWRDIGYHYVIRLDGTIEAGRPLDEIGAHVQGRNTGTIGVCYVGGVTADGNMTPKDTRTPEQKAALDRLLRQLLADNPGITHISGHRDYARKACPSFDATAEYRPLLAHNRAMPMHTEVSRTREEGTPATRSTTVGAATLTGVATTVGTVTTVAREATENGVSILTTLGDMWPLAVAAVVVIFAALYVIRERRRHARESGV